MINRIVPLLFIIIAIAVFFVYTDPTYSKDVQSLRDEIRSVGNARSAAEKFRQTEAQLIQERDTVSLEERRRIEELLPDTVENVDVILDLDSLAEAQNVQIVDVDVSNAPTGGNANGTIIEPSETPENSLLITITALGTYERMRGFIQALERSLRAIDIVEISFPTSQTGVYRFAITLRVYWLR
jgi:hypothetical protein